MRKMLKLNRRTHRYFIEPLSGTQHIKWSLIKRFISFTQKISISAKIAMKILRNIMLLLRVDNIELVKLDAMKKIKNHDASDGKEKCRIDMVKELIEVKCNNSYLEYFNNLEIDHMLEYLCTT